MRKCPTQNSLIGISTILKIYRYLHSTCHHIINTTMTINMVQLFHHQSIFKICKNRSTQPIFINFVQETDRNFSTENFETFYFVYCSLNRILWAAIFLLKVTLAALIDWTQDANGVIFSLCPISASWSSIRKPLSTIIEFPGCKYPLSISDCRCWKNPLLTQISLSEIDPQYKSDTNKMEHLGSHTTRDFRVVADLYSL